MPFVNNLEALVELEFHGDGLPIEVVPGDTEGGAAQNLTTIGIGDTEGFARGNSEVEIARVFQATGIEDAYAASVLWIGTER